MLGVLLFGVCCCLAGERYWALPVVIASSWETSVPRVVVLLVLLFDHAEVGSMLVISLFRCWLPCFVGDRLVPVVFCLPCVLRCLRLLFWQF